MTDANQCGSMWSGMFFCCNQPCSVLESEDERRHLLKNAVMGKKGEANEQTLTGAGIYVQAVSESFKKHFQNDNDLRPIWNSLDRMDIIYAIYYMAQHRSSRIERGLVEPPKPFDDGIQFANRQPIQSGLFKDWIFFADAAYLIDKQKLLEKLKERNHELLRMEDSLQLFEPAYFVSKHDDNVSGRRLLVIGVKGTSSSVDWLTTLWIAKEELNIDVPNDDSDDVRDFGVHGGVLHAARYLLQKIRDIIREYYDGEEMFDIVFVGHSLGAGVAAVCTIILREEECLPNVYCYAYAPPPAVSLLLARKSSSYIYSVVNNDDVIPRVSMKQVKTLVVNIRKAVDKKNRLGGSWDKLIADWEKSDWRDLEQEFAGEWKEGRYDTYVPGRILFLYALGYAQVGQVEVDNDADTLRIAVLSSRMLSDHLLDAYKAGLDPPFYFM